MILYFHNTLFIYSADSLLLSHLIFTIALATSKEGEIILILDETEATEG